MTGRQAVTITFKDEDEQDGVPVGPVIVWDTDKLDAWMRANVPDYDPDHPAMGIPFGSKPDGMEELGWMSKPEALAEARGADWSWRNRDRDRAIESPGASAGGSHDRGVEDCRALPVE